MIGISRARRAVLASSLVFAVAATVHAEAVKMGLWKAFDYDAPDTTPVFYGGESRAENVAVSEYCVYLDVFYADGSVTWGERADFAQGTHDWQKVWTRKNSAINFSASHEYILCYAKLKRNNSSDKEGFVRNLLPRDNTACPSRDRNNRCRDCR